MSEKITYEDFDKVDIRTGRIIEVEDFPEAKKLSYKLKIDFGKEIGIKKSSAQITKLYKKEELLSKQVMAVVNFRPKQIAKFVSEVLTLGVVGKDGVVLLMPDRNVDLGLKMC